MVKFKWETEFKKTEIGEIPKDWEVKVLGQLIKKITKGKVPKKPKKTSKNIEDFLPYLSVEFLRGEKKEAEYFPRSWGIPVTEEDILIIWDGAANGEILKGKKGLLSSTVALIEPNDKVIKKYLFFFLKFFENELKKLRSGTDDRHVDKQALLDFLVTCPPLEEQHRIATILSWFDDLIENKRKQNEILENMAMAIFKSWFIDFEPFQDEEFVYSEELDMEIPEGWEVDFTTRIIDYNPTLKLEKGRIYPFVEMKDVNTNSLVCEFGFKEFSGSGVRYRGGDTLMARITPSLEHGKTAYVWFISENEKGFGTTEFFVLHPKEPWLKEFVYLLAKNEEFREVAINSMTGTSGRQRADVNALKNFKILIPPQPILQRFHSLVEPLFQKIILNQKQILTLKKIRDTLLPHLVFGRLRVVEI